MTSKQLHLGAFMRPVGIHTAWWRYPGANPDANFNFEHLKRFAQTLERVCIETVEEGKMTKDLALLVGGGQAYQTTQEFLASIDDNLQRAMGGAN